MCIRDSNKEHHSREKDRSERDKHHRRHKTDKHVQHARHKETERKNEEVTALSNINEVCRTLDHESIKRIDSLKESVLKTDNVHNVKTESIDDLSRAPVTTVKNEPFASSTTLKTRAQSPDNASKISATSTTGLRHEPPLSNKNEPKDEKTDTPIDSPKAKTPSRKEGDSEVIKSPISTAPRNSLNRKSVLKELKNIPEHDEAAAVEIAMESADEYGDDSDDRWTERPPKSSKKYFYKNQVF